MFRRTLTIVALLSLAVASRAVSAQMVWPYRINQVTYEKTNHFNPTINDVGQMAWCVARGAVYESFFTMI